MLLEQWFYSHNTNPYFHKQTTFTFTTFGITVSNIQRHRITKTKTQSSDNFTDRIAGSNPDSGRLLYLENVCAQ